MLIYILSSLFVVVVVDGPFCYNIMETDKFTCRNLINRHFNSPYCVDLTIRITELFSNGNNISRHIIDYMVNATGSCWKGG